MDGTQTITIEVLIGILGAVSLIVGMVSSVSAMRARKNDDVAKVAKMQSDIDSIKKSVERLETTSTARSDMIASIQFETREAFRIATETRRLIDGHMGESKNHQQGG